MRGTIHKTSKLLKKRTTNCTTAVSMKEQKAVVALAVLAVKAMKPAVQTASAQKTCLALKTKPEQIVVKKVSPLNQTS